GRVPGQQGGAAVRPLARGVRPRVPGQPEGPPRRARVHRSDGGVVRPARVAGVLALFSLLVGALVAILLRPTVPQDVTRYLAMAVVAAIDSSFGGVRAYLERTFNDRIFVLAFVTNAL